MLRNVFGVRLTFRLRRLSLMQPIDCEPSKTEHRAARLGSCWDGSGRYESVTRLDMQLTLSRPWGMARLDEGEVWPDLLARVRPASAAESAPNAIRAGIRVNR